MKPITKAVIDAGLIPKHTLMLFKRWGYLDPDATEIPEETTAMTRTAREIKDSLHSFVEELDALIEEKAEEPIKETRLSITLRNPFRIQLLFEDKYGNWIEGGEDFVVFHDEADYLIFAPSIEIHMGSKFINVATKDWYEVYSHAPLWHDDMVYADQVEAHKIR